jgi:uncharacterized protein (TIGR00251 family)
VKLALKVVPGASSDSMEWMGEGQDILKVRVTAAPEKGKSNKAVEKLIAGRLGLPVSAVTIVSGATGRQKLVEISGLSKPEILAKLYIGIPESP